MTVPLIGFPRANELPALRDALLRIHLLAGSDQSAGDYGRARRIELGAVVLARKRIYLDTRYWIFLREAFAETPQSPKHAELLALLTAGVASGKMVCPLADCAFAELMKQRDPAKRLATAKVMDLLSAGVSLRRREDRLKAELLSFVLQYEDLPQYPVEQMVWTRSSSVMGDYVPSSPLIPEAKREAAEKAFDDFMWTHSLEEMISGMRADKPVEWSYYDRLAEGLNTGKALHAHELKSFQMAFRTELRGAVDAYAKDISEALPYVYSRQVSGEPPTAVEIAESGRELSGLILSALGKDRKSTQLPMLVIPSGILAAIRWDRRRKHLPNDWLDMFHATAGVPYCDLFLTERSLATLLKSPHLAYDKRYSTKVLYDETDAIWQIAADLEAS